MGASQFPVSKQQVEESKSHGSDQAYEEDEETPVNEGNRSHEEEEEQKEYEFRKSLVQKTDFQGSDDEAYQESEDGDEEEENLRDDFSLSDEDYEEIDDNGQDEERRNREFFGDDEYTLLSKVPEDEQNQLMSMTFKEREIKDKQATVNRLKKEIT